MVTTPSCAEVVSAEHFHFLAATSEIPVSFLMSRSEAVNFASENVIFWMGVDDLQVDS